MTPSEAADLLTMAAAYDRRTIGTADALAWHLALERITLDDARQALVAHYQRARDMVMPADILSGVRSIRTRRAALAGDPPPDADPSDPEGYRQALRERRLAIADGSEQTRNRPMHALTVGKSLPPETPEDRAARRAMLRQAAHTKRDATAAEVAERAEDDARRAQARAELAALTAQNAATEETT